MRIRSALDFYRSSKIHSATAILGLGFNISAFALPSIALPCSIIGNLIFLFLIGHFATKQNNFASLEFKLSNDVEQLKRKVEHLQKIEKRHFKKSRLRHRQLLNDVKENANNKRFEQVRKKSEKSLQMIRCVDAKYSLYLRTHPDLPSPKSIFQNDANSQHRLDLSQIYGLALPYSLVGMFKAELIKGIRESSEIILVHQMGKVGSSSLYYSLRNQLRDIPVLQTHSLNAKQVYTSLYNQLLTEIGRASSGWMQLISSLLIVNQLEDENNLKKWKVITLVREPISRNMSAFFQNIDLDIHFPEFVRTGQVLETEVDAAIDLFLERHAHNVPLVWLDQNIRDVFDIDVFSVEFDRSKGYEIYQNKNIEVLLIRLESLDKCCEKAIEEFLGIENFCIDSFNQASQKQYKHIYKEFVNRIYFPQSYVNKMYESKYSTHFYSDDELDEFSAKLKIG